MNVTLTIWQNIIKGIVHPKISILSSFTHPQFVPNIKLILNTKEEILKNGGNQTVDIGGKKSMAAVNCLVTNIL